MTTFLLQETGDRITVETGYGSLLDETSTVRALATVTPSQPVKTVRRQTHRHIATTGAS
jgi:membrane-bound lytic murein transglycosylase B